MQSFQEREICDCFLERADDDSFTEMFRVFSPKLVAFFRRRGCENGMAEDLAQDVMFTVYRKGGQIRDHALFRAWMFQVARHALYRQFALRAREGRGVELADVIEFVPAPGSNPMGATFEFHDWMKFLDTQERQTMELRFIEGWEYHEIAAAQAIPIGTVQWRVFNCKRKLSAHLGMARVPDRKAA